MTPSSLLPALATRAGWLVAALFTALLALTDWSPLERLDLVAYDNVEPMFRAEALAPTSVVVAIDEATLSALGRWPWNRSVHAALIDRLSAAGVAGIGMSILFPESAPGDAEFARALAASRRVVLPVAPRAGDDADSGIAELLPVQQLAANAAALGHVDVELDADGLARRSFAHAGSGSAHWDALALATLKIVRDEPGALTGVGSGVGTIVEIACQQVFVFLDNLVDQGTVRNGDGLKIAFAAVVSQQLHYILAVMGEDI